MGGTYAHRLLGEPVEFGAANGAEPFLAVLTRIDVYRDAAGGLPAVHALLEVDYDTYVRLDESGAFRMSFESIDPATANAQFNNQRNLEITVRADNSLLPDEADTITDKALMDALMAGVTDEAERYLDTTRWKWLSVLQAHAPGATSLAGVRSKFPPK